MFVSFLLPSIFEGVRARHLLVFYKQLADFGREHVAFIGEPDYFRAPGDWQAESRGEWEPSWQSAFEFTPPANLDGVDFEVLPVDLFGARLSKYSSWKTFGQLLRRRLPELERAFAAAIEKLQARAPVEGIIVSANLPSISSVAKRYRLPVIHCEFGPLRKPDYVMTGYWDLRGVGSQTDAVRRFEAFRKEIKRSPAPLFTREELLHTLRRTPMPAVPESREAPFRVGLGLQGDDNTYSQGLGPLDLHSMARRHAERDQILIRHHWGGVTVCSEQLGVIDRSPTATEFIAKCESVMTVTSGLALETLLLGRRSVVIGDSPFQIASDRSLDTRSHDIEIELLALNFLVFGYIVPLELMFNAEYARWRLSGPSESEIVRHHQRWYRGNLTATAQPDDVAVALSVGTKLLHAVPEPGRPEPLLLFGAGDATASLATRVRSSAFELVGLFDNDAQKWGSCVAGLTVEAPSYRQNTSVLVGSLTYADAIVGQLRSLGFPDARILRVR